MPMDVAEVAAHARTENFPIASLLFPREHRPHLRAIYGFARLVDLLGDDWEGDRLAVLDELEHELDRCYSGEPEWPVMRALGDRTRGRIGRDGRVHPDGHAASILPSLRGGRAHFSGRRGRDPDHHHPGRDLG